MAPGSSLRNIRKTLERSASFASGDDYCGCFLTNSIVELAPHNEEIGEILQLATKRQINAFKTALDAAVEAGEISSDTDTRATARFLNATMHGIVVSGKASYGKAAITDIVKAVPFDFNNNTNKKQKMMDLTIPAIEIAGGCNQLPEASETTTGFMIKNAQRVA